MQTFFQGIVLNRFSLYMLMADVVNRIHVISDCSGSDIASQLRTMFQDRVVTDFTDVSDAALTLYHLAKSVAHL